VLRSGLKFRRDCLQVGVLPARARRGDSAVTRIRPPALMGRPARARRAEPLLEAAGQRVAGPCSAFTAASSTAAWHASVSPAPGACTSTQRRARPPVRAERSRRAGDARRDAPGTGARLRQRRAPEPGRGSRTGSHGARAPRLTYTEPAGTLPWKGSPANTPRRHCLAPITAPAGSTQPRAMPARLAVQVRAAARGCR
jgi:hypothetical protein